MTRQILSPVLAASLVITSGLAEAELKAVASFSILGDIVSEIGGDVIEVTTIVGSDSDAHVYVPNIGDAQAIAAADVVFLNGLGFETWAADLVSGSGTSARIVSVADNLPLEIHNRKGTEERDSHEEHDDHDGHEDHGEHDEHEDHDSHEKHEDHDSHEKHEDYDSHGDMEAHSHHDHGELDPHAWGAITNGIAYAGAIRDALIDADPENTQTYSTNFLEFESSALVLRDGFAARIANLPADSVVVTSHDAFGYLAEETGLTFLAPKGMNTVSAASASQVRDLIEMLQELPNAVLFVENVTNPALIEQIGTETGLVVNDQPLYSDALSGPDGPASTYLSWYSHNLESIVSALESK